jgi:hypothetical protein
MRAAASTQTFARIALSKTMNRTRRPFLVNQKPEARYNPSALEQIVGPERR